MLGYSSMSEAVDDPEKRVLVLRRVEKAAADAAAATQELVEAMAEAQGVIARPERLSPKAVREAVIRCIRCTASDGASMGFLEGAIGATRAQIRFATEGLRQDGFIRMSGRHRGARYCMTAKGIRMTGGGL